MPQEPSSISHQSAREDELDIVFKTTGKDIAYESVDLLFATIGSIIPGGAVPAAALNSARKLKFPSPAQKRTQKFLKGLVSDVEKLIAVVEENLNFDSPQWEAAVIRVFENVYRNCQEEKLEALKNVLLNAAMPNPPELDVQLIFLNWIDEFTTLHLDLLNKIAAIEKDIKQNSIDELNPSLPDIEKNRVFYNYALRDLIKNGLLVSQTQSYTTSQSLAMPPMGGEDFYVLIAPEEGIEDYLKKIQQAHGDLVTDVGKLFLSFIQNPIQETLK